MSKDWTEKELQAASQEMKRMGYMGYEEFCEYLKAHPVYTLSKEAITADQFKEVKERQLNGMLNLCPRCGDPTMRTPATHNCLSRHADVYVCGNCGMEEALYDAKGVRPLPLEYWDLAERLE